jgi:hypothetical protein
MGILTAFQEQTCLTRPRSCEIVALGCRPRIQMVLCIFMIERGCDTNLETLNLQSRLIWLLKRLFTDTDMHDPLLREEIEDFHSYLMKIVHVEHLRNIPSKNYDLVLDVTPYQDKLRWSYYYACHDTRCLFWLDAYDTTYITFELDGVESLAHLSASQACAICALLSLIRRTGHRMESFYWYMGHLFLD